METTGQRDNGRDPSQVGAAVKAYHPLGYEVTFDVTADKVDRVCDWLETNGYRSQRGFSYTPEGNPICPKHKIIMNKRNKQDDNWYSHNVGTRHNPLWCRGYPHKSSPGWDTPRVTDPAGLP